MMHRIEIRSLDPGVPGAAFPTEREALKWTAQRFNDLGPDLRLGLVWNGRPVLGYTQMQKWYWDLKT